MVVKMMEMNESPVLMMMQSDIDPLQKDLPVFLYETEVHLIEDVPSFIFVRTAYSIAVCAGICSALEIR